MNRSTSHHVPEAAESFEDDVIELEDVSAPMLLPIPPVPLPTPIPFPFPRLPRWPIIPPPRFVL
ncbi:MAG: hypothetical protein ACK5RL_03635 [Acidimicrobiales bacterium]